MPDLRLVDTSNNNTYPENLGTQPGYLELGVLNTNTPGSYPFHVDSSGNITCATVTASGAVTAGTLNNGSTIDPGPSLAGYKAWSYDPVFSLAAGITASTTCYAALVYVPNSFSCTKVDVYQVSGTPNITVGLWPATAPAGVAVPLAFSAATAAVSATNNTYTFNGSSSASSVALTGGSTYLVTVYGSTTGVVGCLTGTAAGSNANAFGTPWSISTTYRAGTVGTIAGTLSTTSTFGTSALSQYLVWVGLH
jgi:hypothetical protein